MNSKIQIFRTTAKSVRKTAKNQIDCYLPTNQYVTPFLTCHFTLVTSERYMFHPPKAKLSPSKKPCFGVQKTVFCNPKHICFANGMTETAIELTRKSLKTRDFRRQNLQFFIKNLHLQFNI